MSHWYELYSPKLNEEKIVKLFKNFNIKSYNFTNNGYGDYDIYINYELNNYKLELHADTEQLFIYKESCLLKNQKNCKKFYYPRLKVHNDIWFKAVKFITSKMK